uniref:DUF3796 domain-containing protein n=1 Tax=Heterorhabditis bacteriophora TaxID=37862 RepID=A0A1I7X5I2_HETBA
MAIIGAALGSWLLFDFIPGFFFMFGSAAEYVCLFIDKKLKTNLSLNVKFVIADDEDICYSRSTVHSNK